LTYKMETGNAISTSMHNGPLVCVVDSYYSVTTGPGKSW